MSIFNRVYSDMEDKRNRIDKGLLNCIPCAFPRFRNSFPGIEKGKYILVSANSKVGKTQITDHMFLYEPLFYAAAHDLHVKWFYFSWEMSIDQKYRQFISYLLYKLSHIRIDVRQLRSVDANKPLPRDILELLKEERYQKYIKYFEEHVTFVDNVRSPTGVQIFLETYAKTIGTVHNKQATFRNSKTGTLEEHTVFDYFEPNDPELYNIVIFDHLSLMTNERTLDKRNNIELFSKEYMVKLRNRYNFTLVAIQQQAAAQESIENFKVDKLKPSADGLGDCKTTWQDVDLFFGLYAPNRYGVKSYLGYDISRFKDNIRFLELIGGREGGGGQVCPLFFDGAVNEFKELPRPDDQEKMVHVYDELDEIHGLPVTKTLMALVSHKYKKYGKNSWNFWR